MSEAARRMGTAKAPPGGGQTERASIGGSFPRANMSEKAPYSDLNAEPVGRRVRLSNRTSGPRRTHRCPNQGLRQTQGDIEARGHGTVAPCQHLRYRAPRLRSSTLFGNNHLALNLFGYLPGDLKVPAANNRFPRYQGQSDD